MSLNESINRRIIKLSLRQKYQIHWPFPTINCYSDLTLGNDTVATFLPNGQIDIDKQRIGKVIIVCEIMIKSSVKDVISYISTFNHLGKDGYDIAKNILEYFQFFDQIVILNKQQQKSKVLQYLRWYPLKFTAFTCFNIWVRHRFIGLSEPLEIFIKLLDLNVQVLPILLGLSLCCEIVQKGIEYHYNRKKYKTLSKITLGTLTGIVTMLSYYTFQQHWYMSAVLISGLYCGSSYMIETFI